MQFFVHIFPVNSHQKKMRLKEMCTDEMPREKMLHKGAEALSNTDLLAILLRTGIGGKNVIDMSREILLSGDGTLSSLAEMSIDRLCKTCGVGPSKAITIAAAFELGRRVSLEKFSKETKPLCSPRAVFRLMNPIMKSLDHEECWILLLNKTNRLISKERMSSGGMDSTIIDSKSIIRRAIDKKASSVILIHNHPSGNALPSTSDITQTRSLSNALKMCDLSLTDHVIIARDSYYSFADEELVNQPY